jgi:hypothetical protein
VESPRILEKEESGDVRIDPAVKEVRGVGIMSKLLVQRRNARCLEHHSPVAKIIVEWNKIVVAGLE